MKTCVLWDLESIPFKYNCLVRKYINNEFNSVDYHFAPKYMAVSTKNIRLARIKKKRAFELIITEDLTKDGADRILLKKAKEFRDRTIFLVSNDLRMAKKMYERGQDIVVFYNNKSISQLTLPFPTVHVYNNFAEGE